MLFSDGPLTELIQHYIIIPLLLSCVITGMVHAQPESSLQLQTDTSLSTAGYFRLSWPDQMHERQYELQQAKHSDFSDARQIYLGQDQATVISGLPNGHYYYRIRQQQETHWSKTLAVEVKHHSLLRAFSFFSLGALMFIATIGVLIKGTRGQQRV